MKVNKAILLVLICSLLALSTKSQTTEKGRFLIGGESNLNFSSMTYEMEYDGESEELGKTTTLSFSPHVGYFVIDNLAIGAYFPVGYSKEKDEDKSETTMETIGFSPFIKLYLGKGMAKPYLRGSLGFGKSKVRYYDPEYDESEKMSAKTTTYELGTGVGIFINKTISIDLGLNYTHTKLDPEDDDSFYGMDINQITKGVNFSVGFIVLL